MTVDASQVAPDGSPVEIYLAIPAEPDLSHVRGVLRPGWSVLDLGCGVGRIANPLAAAGHPVVAVDDSPVMLAHVEGATPLLADIWSLDLGRRFDAVLALSHLLDSRARARRVQLLEVCARHLAAGGVVVVQRYPPDWRPVPRSSQLGPIGIELHHVTDLGDGFAASVTYSLGDRSWTQTFEGGIVGDDALHALAAETGLEVRGAIDDTGAWVLLGHADDVSRETPSS